MARADQLGAKAGDYIAREFAPTACRVATLMNGLGISWGSEWKLLTDLPYDDWQLFTTLTPSEPVRYEEITLEEVKAEDDLHIETEFGTAITTAREVRATKSLTPPFEKIGGEVLIEVFGFSVNCNYTASAPKWLHRILRVHNLPPLPPAEKGLKERLDEIATSQPAEWARNVIEQVKAIPEIAALLK